MPLKVVLEGSSLEATSSSARLKRVLGDESTANAEIEKNERRSPLNSEAFMMAGA